jgi:NAD(P)-dependent dehydrogenase (short-subunit alcohol dehydrogenase family)
MVAFRRLRSRRRAQANAAFYGLPYAGWQYHHVRSDRSRIVCPGMVDTPMTAGLQREVDRYALKRIAEPMEIAQAILFLTGTESSFVTRAALAVDGGRTFH